MVGAVTRNWRNISENDWSLYGNGIETSYSGWIRSKCHTGMREDAAYTVKRLWKFERNTETCRWFGPPLPMHVSIAGTMKTKMSLLADSVLLQG